ncbi:MAG: hypothetical protein ABJA78_05255 [Ferruginibacter sp.]
MSEDLKDILSNSNKDIDNQQLMDYLSKQLSKEEAHDIEKMMADDEFINDAVEGLQQISNTANIEAYAEQLNYNLQKQLALKKQRKEKRKLKDQPWIYLAIMTILLICTILYFVLKRRVHQQHKQVQPVSDVRAQRFNGLRFKV